MSPRVGDRSSATAIIGPWGEREADLPDGTEGVLARDLDVDRATGLLARRYAAERYPV